MDLFNEDTVDNAWCPPDINEPEEEEESPTNRRFSDSLGFISGDENIVMKPSSISNAWRQGTTPVQKKQQMVSIEKLLATNKLNSLLRGISPAKSPLMAKQQFTDLKTLDRSEPAEELTEMEELSKGAEKKLGGTKTSGLSKELIRVSLVIDV